ncbi:hypothetical protein PoB_000876400 [Plakobranchus ocellatus]|uniref:Uncharacterized protein n=1 Tax=Plakobranchus ocellatus TaxID=259542 RepID=A0AAV3YGX6_9GAST|nr:hypothetical protein PoB_000876400 [Plakobranchus ocellatus]
MQRIHKVSPSSWFEKVMFNKEGLTPFSKQLDITLTNIAHRQKNFGKRAKYQKQRYLKRPNRDRYLELDINELPENNQDQNLDLNGNLFSTNLTTPEPEAAVSDSLTVEPEIAVLDRDQDNLTVDRALDLNQDIPAVETHNLEFKMCQVCSAKLWTTDTSSLCCFNG